MALGEVQGRIYPYDKILELANQITKRALLLVVIREAMISPGKPSITITNIFICGELEWKTVFQNISSIF